ADRGQLPELGDQAVHVFRDLGDRQAGGAASIAESPEDRARLVDDVCVTWHECSGASLDPLRCKLSEAEDERLRARRIRLQWSAQRARALARGGRATDSKLLS